jgi:diacylglycerol kinase family enzyme
VKTALIVNPMASSVTPELTIAVERELAAGGEVLTMLTEAPGHAAELAEHACASCERIVVFSGDGVFNEVVNGLTRDGPIGFLPGGGTSVLPRALGLARDPVAAARSLGRSSRTRCISLGRANGRRFTFSAGIGLDAELIRAVDRFGRRADGKRPGDLAFVRELGRILARHRAVFEPALTVEGHGRAAFALVANCDPYTFVGPLAVHAAPAASFELGLDLAGPRRLGPAGLPRLAWWALARPRQQGHESFLYVHDADELHVRCDRPLPLQLDGEDVGDVEEVEIVAERGVLRVLVPEGP